MVTAGEIIRAWRKEKKPTITVEVTSRKGRKRRHVIHYKKGKPVKREVITEKKEAPKEIVKETPPPPKVTQPIIYVEEKTGEVVGGTFGKGITMSPAFAKKYVEAIKEEQTKQKEQATPTSPLIYYSPEGEIIGGYMGKGITMSPGFTGKYVEAVKEEQAKQKLKEATGTISPAKVKPTSVYKYMAQQLYPERWLERQKYIAEAKLRAFGEKLKYKVAGTPLELVAGAITKGMANIIQQMRSAPKGVVSLKTPAPAVYYSPLYEMPSPEYELGALIGEAAVYYGIGEALTPKMTQYIPKKLESIEIIPKGVRAEIVKGQPTFKPPKISKKIRLRGILAQEKEFIGGIKQVKYKDVTAQLRKGLLQITKAGKRTELIEIGKQPEPFYISQKPITRRTFVKPSVRTKITTIRRAYYSKLSVRTPEYELIKITKPARVEIRGFERKLAPSFFEEMNLEISPKIARGEYAFKQTYGKFVPFKELKVLKTRTDFFKKAIKTKPRGIVLKSEKPFAWLKVEKAKVSKPKLIYTQPELITITKPKYQLQYIRTRPIVGFEKVTIKPTLTTAAISTGLALTSIERAIEKSRVKLSEALAVGYKVKPEEKKKVKVRFVTIPKIKPIQKIIQKAKGKIRITPKPIEAIIPIQKIIPREKIPPRPPAHPPAYTTTKMIPSYPPPPPLLPPVTFKLPKFFGGKVKKLFAKIPLAKQPKKYQPSLAALSLGIKGLKPKQITGLEIRPILRKKARKKKRKKRRKKS